MKKKDWQRRAAACLALAMLCPTMPLGALAEEYAIVQAQEAAPIAQDAAQMPEGNSFKVSLLARPTQTTAQLRIEGTDESAAYTLSITPEVRGGYAPTHVTGNGAPLFEGLTPDTEYRIAVSDGRNTHHITFTTMALSSESESVLTEKEEQPVVVEEEALVQLVHAEMPGQPDEDTPSVEDVDQVIPDETEEIVQDDETEQTELTEQPGETEQIAESMPLSDENDPPRIIEIGGEDDGMTAQEKVVPLSAEVRGGADSVTVRLLTGDISLHPVISLEGGGTSRDIEFSAVGQEVVFDALTPGKYSLELDYIDAVGFKQDYEATVGESSVSFDIVISLIENDTTPISSATGNGAISGRFIGWPYPGKKPFIHLQQGSTVANGALVDENFTFANLLAGEYTLIYGFEGEEASARTKTVSIVKAPAKPQNVLMNVTPGIGEVQVLLTQADALPVVVKLEGAGKTLSETLPAGNKGPVKFASLEAGLYTVTANYETDHGTPAAIQQVSILAKRTALSFTAVTPGENQIRVTGKGEPNSDVLLFTTPYSGTTCYAKTNDKGLFDAVIVCEPGTYTEIAAQYVGAKETLVTVVGTFVVKPSSEKPTLTVDAITNIAKTVYARTEPGTTVEMRTRDYAQKQTADAIGLVHFTLPHTYETGEQITFIVYYGKDNTQWYEQKETVVSGSYYETLRIGSYGQPVLNLTERLSQLGYPIKPTLSYTESVAEAIRLFQRINGLSVDGVAGALTQEVLYSERAIRYDEERYPTLVRGDHGLEAIYRLQQRLKDLGYYTIAVDGWFGAATERAVRDFQSRNGLYANGIASDATQRVLYSAGAIPAYYEPTEYKTLSRSKYYNAAVIPLQRRLKQLGYLSGSVDGYFGSKTYYAVRNFQARNGLEVTGVATPHMQEVLYSPYAKAAGSTPDPTPSYPILSRGSKGTAVKRLQNELLNQGYWQVRTADGIYGQWTVDAVRAFQRDHGLAVDGIAGRRTQNVLYGTNY